MKSFIKSLNNKLTRSPFKLQMAVDRQWEEAWKINFDNFKFSEDEIRKFVGKDTQIVAVELFYKTNDKRDFYFGVQYHPDLKRIENPYTFLKTYLSTLKELKDRSIYSVISNLGQNLNGNKETFLTYEPSSIVIGIVDWWMTFGPCTIWEKGEEKFINSQILHEKLESNKNLISNGKNYPGLEFVYNYTPKHWISFQVGEKEGSEFKLDASHIVELLEALLDFKQS